MIDLATMEDDLFYSWDAYLEEKLNSAPQIILGNQDSKPDKLTYPRIVYHISTPYNTASSASAKQIDIVPSNDPNFDKDIEYTYLLNPKIRISINGYGETVASVRKNVVQLREWFEIPKLGNRFFKNYNGHIMLNQLSNVNDRTTQLREQFENRYGFDAIVSFDDRVKVREKTIETIEITREDGIENIDV